MRQAIAEHRRRLHNLYRELPADDSHPDAERTADILLMLRDGLAVGLDLDDPARVRATVQETLSRVLGQGGATSERGATAGQG
ncbi:hypothetical protein ACFYO2_46770 [Streptomyces sp. NPDC006602]|uniref:hypothetical protein n=1 Tax=Streptomyces sp. NPDC006602 TaxID=3364751 RepID=UPI00368FC2E0